MGDSRELPGGCITAKCRSEKIRDWVKAASAKPDPAKWVHTLFDDALHHLDGHPDGTVKEQAKRELFALRKDVLAGIVERSAE
jgi:hypothetical protein